MAIQFTQNGRKALFWAQEEAMRLGQPSVEPEHLLLGLIHEDGTAAIRLLDRLGVAASQIRDAAAARMPDANGSSPAAASSQLSPATLQVIEQAYRETGQTGNGHVGTEHLLLALTRGSGSEVVSEALQILNIRYERALPLLSSVRAETSGAADSAAETTRQESEVRPGFLKGRDLLSIADFSQAEIRGLFELTREIKSGRYPANGQQKSLALIFEKPSLRTRVTFSVAMTRLGGQSIYLSPTDIGLGTRESVADVARCLERWVDAVAARTFSHDTVTQLADAANIPVINALTDREHPCQALADFYTILEKKSDTRGMTLAFVGDGHKVAHSLMLLAPLLGPHFTLACPPGYAPASALTAQAQARAREHGTTFSITSDAMGAVDDADVVYIPMSGPRWGRRTNRSAGHATSRASRLMTIWCARRRKTFSFSTACPPIAARRLPIRFWKAPARASSTRPKSASCSGGPAGRRLIKEKQYAAWSWWVDGTGWALLLIGIAVHLALAVGIAEPHRQHRDDCRNRADHYQCRRGPEPVG